MEDVINRSQQVIEQIETDIGWLDYFNTVMLLFLCFAVLLYLGLKSMEEKLNAWRKSREVELLSKKCCARCCASIASDGTYIVIHGDCICEACLNKILQDASCFPLNTIVSDIKKAF